MKFIKKILLIGLLFIPLTVRADFKVEHHVIDAEIEIGGALNVKELVVLEGEGEFFSRNLNYYSFGSMHWAPGDEVNLDNGIIYNGQLIKMVNVLAYPFEGKVDLNNLTNSNSDYFKEFNIEKPSDNTYKYEDNKDGTGNLKIYYKVKKGEKIAFYYNYIIANVIVEHNDVKELNYTFKNLNLHSADTALRLIIPYPTTDDKYHIWIHGNQSGRLEEITNSKEEKLGVFASFPEVKDSINVRTTLPQEQVGISINLNKSEIDALDEVIKIENTKLDKTKQSNSIIKIVKYSLLVLSAIYVLASILILFTKNNLLFIVYSLFGALICLTNYLFGYNLWFLYLVICLPILVFILKKYVIKDKNIKVLKKKNAKKK